MEQTLGSQIWVFRSFVFRLMVASVTILSGCKSEDPNPQLSDVIFKTIEGDLKAAQSLETSTTKQVEELEQKLSKTEARTKDRKIVLRDLEKAKRVLKSTSQRVKYLEIRLERRQSEVRGAYREAFLSEKPWPNTREAELFMTHRRLRNPTASTPPKALQKKAQAGKKASAEEKKE